MATEFPSKYPAILSPFIDLDLRSQIHDQNFEVAKGAMNGRDLEIAYKLVACAKKIAPAICSLPENQGKEGFVVVFTNRSDSFNLTFQVGRVTDPDEVFLPGGKLEKYCIFARLKAQVLKDHPEFISSGQNLALSEDEKLRSPADQEIPSGAIAFGDYIVSVSAFKNANMDTANAIAIGIGAGLTTIDGAEKIATDPRVSCNEFIANEDKIIL